MLLKRRNVVNILFDHLVQSDSRILQDQAKLREGEEDADDIWTPHRHGAASKPNGQPAGAIAEAHGALHHGQGLGGLGADDLLHAGQGSRVEHDAHEHPQEAHLRGTAFPEGRIGDNERRGEHGYQGEDCSLPIPVWSLLLAGKPPTPGGAGHGDGHAIAVAGHHGRHRHPQAIGHLSHAVQVEAQQVHWAHVLHFRRGAPDVDRLR
mmetsp:Transcript_8940/g.21215  ORF Transcript_8940/g.21215 Transcript_8940/m.21215 type:complete len:207 (-) Transcript_8940:129-749(-)